MRLVTLRATGPPPKGGLARPPKRYKGRARAVGGTLSRCRPDWRGSPLFTLIVVSGVEKSTGAGRVYDSPDGELPNVGDAIRPGRYAPAATVASSQRSSSPS
jgi:hypothetical protein